MEVRPNFCNGRKISKTFNRLVDRIQAGQTESEAFGNTGIELIQAAEVSIDIFRKFILHNCSLALQLHGRCFVASTFYHEVTGSKANSRSPAFQKVLEKLLDLYLVNLVLKHLNEIIRVGHEHIFHITFYDYLLYIYFYR